MRWKLLGDIVPPSSGNGLKRMSQIMADRIVALPRGECGPPIGRLDPAAAALERMPFVVLGMAD